MVLDGWMDGWMGGWVDGRARLRIASIKKLMRISSLRSLKQIQDKGEEPSNLKAGQIFHRGGRAV